MNYGEVALLGILNSLHTRNERTVVIKNATIGKDVQTTIYHGLGRVPRDVQIVASPGNPQEFPWWSHIPPDEQRLYLMTNDEMTVDILVRG